jgi:hypothetical protein
MQDSYQNYHMLCFLTGNLDLIDYQVSLCNFFSWFLAASVTNTIRATKFHSSSLLIFVRILWNILHCIEIRQTDPVLFLCRTNGCVKSSSSCFKWRSYMMRPSTVLEKDIVKQWVKTLYVFVYFTE